MTVHVRWPARPAEHRPGLNFLCYFLCFKTKKVNEDCIRQKVDKTPQQLFLFIYFLLLVSRFSSGQSPESNKEKHTANDLRPLAAP
jgi:hypothetical protein